MKEPKRPTVTTDEPSMKWYNFLIRFALFLAAGISISNGFMYFSGQIYLGMLFSAEAITALYESHPWLKEADIIYSVLCLGMGALAFFVRSRLAKFHCTAPSLLLFYPILCAFLSVVYTFISNAILGYSIWSSLIYLGVVAVLTLAITLIHNAYFKKRDHLFYNK